MGNHIHPLLGDLCSSVGRKSAVLDLLTGNLDLEGIHWPPKLARVCATEGRIFAEMLERAEVDRRAIASAVVEFEFQLPNSSDPASCVVRVETDDGTVDEQVANAGYPRPKGPE